MTVQRRSAGADTAPGTERPRVSVIVVSYNRERDLRLCLEALLASTYPALEVIVVDNASSDRAAEVAMSFSAVRVIRSPDNLGFAGGNNLGVRYATGAYLALVNNDAVVDQRWVEELVTFLESHPEAAAAGGRQYFWDEHNRLGDRSNRFVAYSVLQPDGSSPAVEGAPDEVREVGLLSGSNVMLRRTAMEDVGEPFLEPLFFMYYEETDFFARAIRKGWRLFYVGTATCWHRVRTGASKPPYHYHYYLQRNRLLFAYRHFDDAGLSRVVKAARARAVQARLLRGLLFGRPEPTARRAHREAWEWAEQHRPLLTEQRARHAQSPGSYEQALRAIDSRAEYHGRLVPRLAALVPADARHVVVCGCDDRDLWRALRRARPGIEVHNVEMHNVEMHNVEMDNVEMHNVEMRGVEAVVAAAALAQGGLGDVVVGTAEAPLPEHWPPPECVIFADVLEHLADPWTALRRWRAILAPGGTLVASIPNVAHHSVLRALLRGHWDHESAGFLDRPASRRFTRASAVALLEGAGFRVERMERVERLPAGALRPLLRGALLLEGRRKTQSGRFRHPVGHLADFATSHYLIVAR